MSRTPEQIIRQTDREYRARLMPPRVGAPRDADGVDPIAHGLPIDWRPAPRPRATVPHTLALFPDDAG
jgi:hypothetical protein